MAYEVRVYTDPAVFLEEAEALLYRDEVRHCLILGIVGELAEARRVPQSPNRFWTVSESGSVVLAAMMTPPFPISLSTGPVNAARRLAAELRGAALPGISGPAEVSAAFALAWAGDRTVARRRLRVHRLDAVDPPESALGRLRAATAADAAVLGPWIDAFQTEADIEVRRPGVELVRSMIEAEQLFVWEVEGSPVSLAAWGRPTRNGVSIKMVYTPPEYRGRGYASSVVAALSSRLLAEGRQFCALFTDLANPTANKIYRRIGYRPAGDHDDWSF